MKILRLVTLLAASAASSGIGLLRAEAQYAYLADSGYMCANEVSYNPRYPFRNVNGAGGLVMYNTQVEMFAPAGYATSGGDDYSLYRGGVRVDTCRMGGYFQVSIGDTNKRNLPNGLNLTAPMLVDVTNATFDPTPDCLTGNARGACGLMVRGIPNGGITLDNGNTRYLPDVFGPIHVTVTNNYFLPGAGLMLDQTLPAGSSIVVTGNYFLGGSQTNQPVPNTPYYVGGCTAISLTFSSIYTNSSLVVEHNTVVDFTCPILNTRGNSLGVPNTVMAAISVGSDILTMGPHISVDVRQNNVTTTCLDSLCFPSSILIAGMNAPPSTSITVTGNTLTGSIGHRINAKMFRFRAPNETEVGLLAPLFLVTNNTMSTDVPDQGYAFIIMPELAPSLFTGVLVTGNASSGGTIIFEDNAVFGFLTAAWVQFPAALPAEGAPFSAPWPNSPPYVFSFSRNTIGGGNFMNGLLFFNMRACVSGSRYTVDNNTFDLALVPDDTAFARTLFGAQDTFVLGEDTMLSFTGNRGPPTNNPNYNFFAFMGRIGNNSMAHTAAVRFCNNQLFGSTLEGGPVEHFSQRALGIDQSGLANNANGMGLHTVSCFKCLCGGGGGGDAPASFFNATTCPATLAGQQRCCTVSNQPKYVSSALCRNSFLDYEGPFN